MTRFVSCVVHRIQLSKQLVVCGFLVIGSVSNSPSVSLKLPYDDILGTFADLLGRLVDPLGALVNALL
jgi:hypothetical protein